MIDTLPDIPLNLMQPTSFNNNDTSETETGVNAGEGAAETDGAEKLRMMMRMFKV